MTVSLAVATAAKRLAWMLQQTDGTFPADEEKREMLEIFLRVKHCCLTLI